MPIVGATEDFDKPAPIVMRPEDPDKIDLAPAIVTFMTTEHFVLQTARAATIAETNGRTALFLGSVSSVLVALAFRPSFEARTSILRLRPRAAAGTVFRRASHI
jgi:hypothetical protein